MLPPNSHPHKGALRLRDWHYHFAWAVSLSSEHSSIIKLLLLELCMFCIYVRKQAHRLARVSPRGSLAIVTHDCIDYCNILNYGVGI